MKEDILMNPKQCISCGNTNFKTITIMPKYNPDGEPKERIALCGECMLKITNGTIYNRLLLADLPKESIEEFYKGIEWVKENKEKIEKFK